MGEAVVKNRRSLTPSTGLPLSEDVHATRRAGARHEVSVRVTLTPKAAPGGKAKPQLEGWALNVSRGGVRVILEETVELGSEYEVEVGEGSGPATCQPGHIVWVQEEPDGVIAGIAFRNGFVSGQHDKPDDG
jgi:hypothetical protein